MLTNIREGIAEALFSDIIDEAFRQGIAEGRRAAVNNIGFQVRNADLNLTPARKEGYQKAVDIIDTYKTKMKDMDLL